MAPRRHRLGAAVVLALVAVMAVACGGDGTPLSRADFTARADAACEELQKASDTFQTAQGEDVRGEELTKRLTSAADSLDAFADELDEPVPPEVIADLVDQLVDDVGSYAELLRELGEKAGPDDDYTRLLNSNAELVGRLNDINTRVATSIQQLQFGGCMTPGS